MIKELAALVTALEEQGKAQGLSRTQLAAKLGVSENYLYRIKDGSRTPGMDLMTAVRREFPSLKPLVWEYEEALTKGADNGNHTEPEVAKP